MFEILQFEGPHVVGTNFGKGLGGGIFEFRLDQDAAQVLARKGKRARPDASETAKILLRVFCHAHGNRIVLLLGGYDKGERPSARHQQAQIELAKARLKAWEGPAEALNPRLTILVLSHTPLQSTWRQSSPTSWPS